MRPFGAENPPHKIIVITLHGGAHPESSMCPGGVAWLIYHQESFWVVRIIENDVWIYRHQMSAQVSSEMLKLSETNLVVLGDCKQTITKSLETIQPQ